MSGVEARFGVGAAIFKPSRLELSLSVGASVALNILFCWVFFVSSAEPPAPEEPMEDVQWVALTALGEPAPPKAVPRIVAPPPPPPPTADAVSLSREVKEKPKRREKPKKPKKPKKREKPKKKPKPKKRATKRQPKRAQPKKLTLNSLFSSSSDERADRGPRRGSRKGHAQGTSSQELDSTEMSVYISRVSTLVSRRLMLPNAISPQERKRLSASIYIKVGSNRKVKGKPKWRKRSGNRLFDQAAMDAVMAFTEDGPGKLMLPRESKAKKAVLRQGLNLLIDGDAQ